MQNVFRLLLLGLILILTLNGNGQPISKQASYRYAVKQLSDYLSDNSTLNTNDSVLNNTLMFLQAYFRNKELQQNIKEVMLFIEENNFEQHAFILNQYVDSLHKVKDIYNIHRQELCGIDSILMYADSTGLSSADSGFTSMLDVLSGNPLAMDSLVKQKAKLDSLLKATYISDTLFSAFDSLEYFLQNNDLIDWMNAVRRDTTRLYVIDLNGDSVLVKLYNGNPDMVRLNINDFWGSDIPAVIRDIQANSFRLLVDDLPDIENDVKRHSLHVHDSVNTVRFLGQNIVMQKRMVPPVRSHWMFYGNASLDASQTGLYQWSAGGESTISFLTALELYAKYKKNKITLDNYFKFKFGVLRTGPYDNSTTDFFKPTNDKIDIQTKLGYKTWDKVSTSVLANFKSQAAKGYEYPTDTTRNRISQFMNPGYFTIALGFDFQQRNGNSYFISPLTSKNTFVTNDSIDETDYGLDEGTKVKYELGAIIKASVKTRLWQNITMENTIELFSSYLNTPQNIDVDWDFKLVLPVNDYIRTTVTTSFIYDDDAVVPKKEGSTTVDSKGVQFKETFALGFYMIF